MEMKKMICILLSAVCMMGFVSCGSEAKESAGAEGANAAAGSEETGTDGKWKLIAVDQGNGDVLDIDESKNYKCYEFSGGSGSVEERNPVKNEKRTVFLKKSGDSYKIVDGAVEITGVRFENGQMRYTNEMNMTYIFEKQ